MPCLRGACLKALVGGSSEVLVPKSCKICSGSSGSFMLWHEDLAQGLLQVLV